MRKESATLAALALDSRYYKTNEVFSVLIDGGPRWLGHKHTYAINDPFQYEHAQWGAPTNALMIVVSWSVRQGVKE